MEGIRRLAGVFCGCSCYCCCYVVNLSSWRGFFRLLCLLFFCLVLVLVARLSTSILCTPSACTSPAFYLCFPWFPWPLLMLLLQALHGLHPAVTTVYANLVFHRLLLTPAAVYANDYLHQQPLTPATVDTNHGLHPL